MNLLAYCSRSFLLQTERGVSTARLSRDRMAIESDEWGALPIAECVPDGCVGGWPRVIIPAAEADRADFAFLRSAGVRTSEIPPLPEQLDRLLHDAGAVVYFVSRSERGEMRYSTWLSGSRCFWSGVSLRDLTALLRRPSKAAGLLNRFAERRSVRKVRAAVRAGRTRRQR